MKWESMHLHPGKKTPAGGTATGRALRPDTALPGARREIGAPHCSELTEIYSSQYTAHDEMKLPKAILEAARDRR
jgi:hypothetical protein